MSGVAKAKYSNNQYTQIVNMLVFCSFCEMVPQGNGDSSKCILFVLFYKRTVFCCCCECTQINMDPLHFQMMSYSLSNYLLVSILICFDSYKGKYVIAAEPHMHTQHHL